MEAYENENEEISSYAVRIKKGWFRGKDVFTDRLYVYERALADYPSIIMPINAGNMIYIMMRRLEIGVDWDKQDALIRTYRDLMYKLSYVDAVWYRDDLSYIYIEGKESDVMWTIAFITQVFPDDPLECESISSIGETFIIQNGADENGGNSAGHDGVLPDIWHNSEKHAEKQIQTTSAIVYDETFEPSTGDMFALPDGRIAQYVRMDDRFIAADTYGADVDAILRHNISASLIKDFEDLVHSQTTIDYDLYKMRYVAFMNKTHALEKKLGGLEVSCYDILPIGERGLPYASKETLERTNMMDKTSLQYIADKIKRNKTHLTDKEKKNLLRDVGMTVLYRIDGYDIEFQTYRITGSDEKLCEDIRLQYCYDLYADFAEIESYNLLRLQTPIYRALCNDPESDAYQMTAFERQRLQLFGRGYADFLSYQLKTMTNKKLKQMYAIAWKILKKNYLK